MIRDTRYDILYRPLPNLSWTSNSVHMNASKLQWNKTEPAVSVTTTNPLHKKNIAQSLQPQAALFKSWIDVGTNEFLTRLSLQWGGGDSVSSATRQELKFCVEDRTPLSLPENWLFPFGLKELVFILPHHLHGGVCQTPPSSEKWEE